MSQSITLDNTNSVQILIQYTELVQQKGGVFTLEDAGLIKRAVDVLINSVNDQEINDLSAKNILIQSVNKAQLKGGVFTLNDAALLWKVVQFIVQTTQSQPAQPQPAQPQPAQPQPAQQESKIQEIESTEEELDDYLSELSQPIPLKPHVI